VFKVKICGVITQKDALEAVQAGADALGFVFFKGSPRWIEPKLAREIVGILPSSTIKVGVFVNSPQDEVELIAKAVHLDLVQLHGDESPQYCSHLRWPVLKAVRVQSFKDLENLSEYPVQGFLFDSFDSAKFGGTGRSFAWKILSQAAVPKPYILSGGLSPANVEKAILVARPAGVDVSSGVERKPGQKDKEKMRKFVERALGALERIGH
jgi:phosphoribosylanthranilate isomerase